MRREDGQASVEYAMILVLIAIVFVFAMVAVVGPARALFNSIPGLLFG